MNNAGRTNDFRLDPSITTGSALPSDYYKSGYDRGHLAPAADMGWSSESVSESFYMSNMTPQLPDFNRGMWKDLEGMVRQWAVRFGEVTVVTGPVLEKSAAEYSSIGKNNVSVPEFFYKALLAQNEGKYISIGFILPNKKCTGTVFDYAVSVDEVERRTELDFFSRLPDSVEEFVESRTVYSLWKSGTESECSFMWHKSGAALVFLSSRLLLCGQFCRRACALFLNLCFFFCCFDCAYHKVCCAFSCFSNVLPCFFSCFFTCSCKFRRVACRFN